MDTDESVHLRPVLSDDLPRMFEIQLDPESNRMAVTIPRTRESFDSHWAKCLGDPAVAARAIVVGGQFVGIISCFPLEGRDQIGYWVARAFWGKGIASRALQLLLLEDSRRPVYATVATGNGASLRVLQKNGFSVVRVYLEPASERFPESEVVDLVLV